MSGEFGLPFRAPCTGWPNKQYRYVCNTRGHYLDSDNIPIYPNTTTVPDYQDPPGDNIGPYTRPKIGVVACGGTGQIPCGPWPEPVPGNSFGSSTGTVNLAACRKLGFKTVFAFKSWHGRLGFFADPAGTPESRYRSISVHGTLNTTYLPGGDFAGGTVDVTNEVKSGYTVGRYSGKVTQDQCELDVNDYYPETPDFFADMLAIEGSNGVLSVPHTGGGPDPFTDLVNGDAADAGEHPPDLTWLMTAKTFNDTTIDITLEYYQTAADDFSVPPEELTYSQYKVHTLHVVITLGDAYSQGSVYGDCAALLGYWNLLDDKQLTWRTDGYCTAGPKVSYHEAGPTEPPRFLNTCEDTPPNQEYTGDVLGAPTTIGAETYFDFRAPVYNPGTSGAAYGDLSGWGEYQPGYARHATQWTSLPDRANFIAGAWAHYGGRAAESPLLTRVGGAPLYGGTLILAKYAEIITQDRPSHNYARPCGKDRYLMDHPTARCITDLTAGVVTLATASGIATDTICMVVGWGEEDGIYSPTRSDDYTYSLGTKLHDLPDGFTSGSPYFGAVRWPDSPPLCEPLDLTDATNASPIVIETKKDCLLRTGDSVVIAGVTGNTNANTAWTVTRIDNQHFSLDGSSGNAAYTGGGQVSSYGGPAYYWNDNQRKGNWVLNTNGTLSQQCAAFTPCEPYVVCITPNGETPAHGMSVNLPAPAFSDIVGALWYAHPIQWMTDPLYQSPPQPCDIGPATYTEDDGGCAADGEGAVYYPTRLWEEAELARPDGSPAFPAGVAIALGGAPGQGGCIANPWIISTNQPVCIEAGGRFACEYADREALCLDEFDL